MNEYGQLLENVSLKEYTTLKVGGICRYLIKPYNEEKLAQLVKYLKKNNIKYYLLGNGSNVILDDSFFDGVIILFNNLNNIEINDNILTVSAGVKLPYLVKYLLEREYTTLSFAAMIPGTVGGSIVGNAGAYNDEILNYIKQVKVMDKDGNVKYISKDEISYGYRYTSIKDKYIVLSADFILDKKNLAEVKNLIIERNNKRLSTQPLDKPNVGSIFRNPENDSSGRLIDSLNLKKYTIGGAMISEKHANFIVNENNASFDDIVNLIAYIKKQVKDNYDVDLIVEPSVVYWNKL